jgi:hypothetical protein
MLSSADNIQITTIQEFIDTIYKLAAEFAAAASAAATPR